MKGNDLRIDTDMRYARPQEATQYDTLQFKKMQTNTIQ